jgi:hypothetical protein
MTMPPTTKYDGVVSCGLGGVPDSSMKSRCMTDKPKSESASQIEKFRQLARELDCDESEEAFKAKLKAVAKAPRAPTGKPKPPNG